MQGGRRVFEVLLVVGIDAIGITRFPRILHDAGCRVTLFAGVGALCGFHGFAGVDWMHDTDKDRVYLIEFNPRPTPTYHLDAHSRVSFARSFRAMLEGARRIGCPDPSAAACGSVIHLFPQSLYRAVSERDLNSLLRCWSDAPWSDPLLMAAYLRRVFTHFLPMRWRQAVKRLLRRRA
ncbi:hypothetical protein [Methylococcus geothermalis]|uniref:hypothetical protein n=1 Tax=Methylococcus geothermalis TaxID=2681310 RepID=UPI001E32C500|nr:hypothetical protein [Methylococcus geothermalis]